MNKYPRFEVGDEPVLAFITEHSIPTAVCGIVVKVTKTHVTVRATDGWEGEAGNEVTVPEYDVEWDG